MSAKGSLNNLLNYHFNCMAFVVAGGINPKT